jgi:hypothetical protein
MQMDIVSMMIANLLFSVRMVPIILIVVGLIRGVILLVGGRRREFEDWTRNKWMAGLSTFFFLGMVVHMAIRYVVARLFFISVNRVALSSTYMEPNIVIGVDRPPRTLVVVLSFFVASVLSTFVAFLLLIFPTQLTVGDFLIDMIVFLLCWWTSVGIFFNTSIRTGDISLIGASLQKQPKSGPFELCLVTVGLIILYTQLWGLPL